MEKIKILIATGLYPPDVGGPATYSKTLAEELPKRGIDASVLSFGSVRNLPKIARHMAYFFKALRAGRGVDIIFAQDPVSVGLPACLAAFFLKKRFMLKVVGDYAWEQYMQTSEIRNPKSETNALFETPEAFQTKRVGPITWLRKKIERGVARRAERIIVPSKYLKQIVSQWGVSEDRIFVVYNSSDTVSIPEEKVELRSLMGVEGKAILSAGRLVPWKGFAALIEIMSDILKEFPDAKLYIAGDGTEREALKLKTKDYGLTTSVVFLGALPRATLLRYIKASDVFVLNTGYEGFSHQLLEVMSVGTPIVTTDIGGNPELIEGGTEGILVSYNNHAELLSGVLGILSGSIDRDALMQNAQAKVSQFTKERMIEETIKILS